MRTSFYSYLIFATLLWVFSFGAVKSQSTQGPNSPGTTSTGACFFSFGSTLAYSPSGNIVSSNNIRASVTHCGCCDANTNCLRATNFGFTIPPGSIINGITVEIEKRSDAGSFVQDNEIELLKAGIEVGSNYASAAAWPSSDTYITYGGCSDLWGTTWTAADINASNFGVVLAAIDYSCAGNIVSSVDHIRITICYTSTLPVELTRFNAKEQEKSILLSWTTQSEINNAYFIVEHSNDGIFFSPIATISGAGTSNITHEYSFVSDFPFQGMNYYRLLQLDYNGSTEIFGPEALEYKNETPFVALANWHNDLLSIYISSNKQTPINVTILSLTGQVISTRQHNVNKGNNTIEIEMSDLSKGVYTVCVNSGNDQKITVVKTFK